MELLGRQMMFFFVNREKQTIHIILRASNLETRFVFIFFIINLRDDIQKKKLF